MSENLSHDWEIGLSSWIIQDGNYGDFTTGQIAEFALEFHPNNVHPSDVRVKTAKPLGGAQYQIIGEIIYCATGVWAIDFGISAFKESEPPADMKLGNFVAAEIYLGIDPFSYFERLATLPGMPPLIHTWKINSIAQQTAPFIESQDASGRKMMVRDEKKAGYKTINQTNAWKDDKGLAEYNLNCARLDIPPKYKSATAT